MNFLRHNPRWIRFQDWTHAFGKTAEKWGVLKLSFLFIGVPLSIALPCNYFCLEKLRKTFHLKETDDNSFEDRLYYTSRLRQLTLFFSCICILQALSRGSKALMYFWFPFNITFYGVADALNTCTRIRCHELKEDTTLDLWSEVQRVPEVEDFINWLSDKEDCKIEEENSENKTKEEAEK